MLRGSSARKLKSESMSAHQSTEEVFPPSNAETELIERCRASDEEAWDALFDKYYAAVARFVFQLSADFGHEDTEEICQETFLSVVRNLESFHGKSSFQTWLFRIATNKAMDFRQKMHAT
jgi:RNA polymerase sigma-70 factor (ECF subfamily)